MGSWSAPKGKSTNAAHELDFEEEIEVELFGSMLERFKYGTAAKEKEQQQENTLEDGARGSRTRPKARGRSKSSLPGLRTLVNSNVRRPSTAVLLENNGATLLQSDKQRLSTITARAIATFYEKNSNGEPKVNEEIDSKNQNEQEYALDKLAIKSARNKCVDLRSNKTRKRFAPAPVISVLSPRTAVDRVRRQRIIFEHPCPAPAGQKLLKGNKILTCNMWIKASRSLDGKLVNDNTCMPITPVSASMSREHSTAQQRDTGPSSGHFPWSATLAQTKVCLESSKSSSSDCAITVSSQSSEDLGIEAIEISSSILDEQVLLLSSSSSCSPPDQNIDKVSDISHWSIPDSEAQTPFGEDNIFGLTDIELNADEDFSQMSYQDLRAALASRGLRPGRSKVKCIELLRNESEKKDSDHYLANIDPSYGTAITASPPRPKQKTKSSTRSPKINKSDDMFLPTLPAAAIEEASPRRRQKCVTRLKKNYEIDRSMFPLIKTAIQDDDKDTWHSHILRYEPVVLPYLLDWLHTRSSKVQLEKLVSLEYYDLKEWCHEHGVCCVDQEYRPSKQ